MIGGMMGAVTNIAGGIVGGDTGKQISNAGSMVTNVSTAAATGDAGAIINSAT
jgi:hypothetical protein